MPYPEELVAPMRQELSDLGFTHLTTPDEVDAALNNPDGTTFLVVNSVCGCAVKGARPAVRLALSSGARPKRLVSVFAGQETDAVARAREHLGDFSPSSPAYALFKGGRVVEFIGRHEIEGRMLDELVGRLSTLFARHCSDEVHNAGG